MDSSASIDIKTLQKSPLVCFKLPPPEFKKTYIDNEFANLLNARKKHLPSCYILLFGRFTTCYC